MKLSKTPSRASIYLGARKAGLKPALLETPRSAASFSPGLSILGIAPSGKLEVWCDRLYLDGKLVGNGKDVFRFLQLRNGPNFFPAWIGFFAYEYARHLGFETRLPCVALPEATFYLYDAGFVWNQDQLIEKPKELNINFEEPCFTTLQPQELRSSMSDCEYIEKVKQIHKNIRRGLVYQVNLSRQYFFDASKIDPLAMYLMMKQSNQSPFMGLLEGETWAIASGSPERLFRYHENRISTRPIAGTRRRGSTEQLDNALERDLLNDKKERAEHIMLVDLLRNDVAKVALPGTVSVDEAFTVERYSHVMHLVSEVNGESKASLCDVFQAIFPGGTITGAPKEQVMTEIASLETEPRGSYTGSMGYVSSGYGADFNILIRSATIVNGLGQVSAGAGIVIESIPEKEVKEVEQKAANFRFLLEGGKRGQACKDPVVRNRWKPPKTSKKCDAKIAFVENHDSFSFNIVDYLKILGCEVHVLQNEPSPKNMFQFSHIVVGPGPGDPYKEKNALSWTNFALENEIPFLGICLGHQALGVALGADLVRANRPIHGELESISHFGKGLFWGMANPIEMVRYHSLVLGKVPDCFKVHAWSMDNHVMAITHKSFRAFGIQFHPESFQSKNGIRLLENFLASTRKNYNIFSGALEL